MSIFQALVLGIVQGATEFLPISSHGHLTLVPFIVGWETPSVSFDIALHAGTLIAVLIVFWPRVAPMIRAIRQPDVENRQLLTLLFIGTLPAAVLGLALNSLFEKTFERPVLDAIFLAITGYLLFVGERILKEQDERVAESAVAVRAAAARGENPDPPWKPRDEKDLNEEDAILIGIAQAASILPAISRSGATVVAGLARGISRETAVRFSFLLSIPAIAGAIIAKLPDMAKEFGNGDLVPMLVGVAAATVSGIVAIRTFIRIFATRGLKGFGVYCYLMAVAAIVTALARG